MKKLFLIALFLFLANFSNASGQQTQPEKDPLGCSTEEGKKLNFLIGTWNVKSKFRTGSNPDKWEETAGKSKIKYLFNECLAQEKLEVTRSGRPLTLIAMYSYNNFTQNYQWMFAHSEHGLLSLFEGPYKEDKFILKNSLTLGSRTILFERHLSRTQNGFQLIAKRSFDNGKTWRVDWFLNYYR